MLVGAAPSWFADNLVAIAAVVLVVVTLLILKVVKDATTRMIFVGVVVGLAVFVYANRVQLESCARTCECRLLRQDVTVPVCNPDLDLSAMVSTAPRRT